MSKVQVVYRKSLLYKTKVEYGDYTINHVEGCSHGCRYPCYAMLMSKRFGRITCYNDWLKPKIVANAMELLEKEIPKLKNKIEFVHLCFMTDPFMVGYPEVWDLSQKIIMKLNSHGIKVTTLTKGIYPKPLAEKANFLESNEYGITLVSVEEQDRKNYEPFASIYEERINSLKKLHEAGFKTWVSMEPYTTPNMINQNIFKILEKVSFVDKIVFGRLNYNGKATSYPNHKRFYNECCAEVIHFCKTNGIGYYIKNGTYTQEENHNIRSMPSRMVCT